MIGFLQGRSLQDLQNSTRTLISVSPKSLCSSNDRGWIVTILGAQSNVQYAANWIERVLAMEQEQQQSSEQQRLSSVAGSRRNIVTATRPHSVQSLDFGIHPVQLQQQPEASASFASLVLSGLPDPLTQYGHVEGSHRQDSVSAATSGAGASVVSTTSVDLQHPGCTAVGKCEPDDA